MIENARLLAAHAVMAMRSDSSEIGGSSLAYGAAVDLADHYKR